MTTTHPTTTGATATSTSPAIWPREAMQLIDRALTVQYASLTRAGEPITLPVTPYRREGTGTLDVSTGLTYPTKAARARRNPRVALLFADAVGSGVVDAPVVAVQGLATVDDDLQAGTDRYVAAASAKFPASFRGLPDAVIRRMDWYFARIWIGVAPARILWWPRGDLGSAPEEWVDTAVELPEPLMADTPSTTTPPIGPPQAPVDWRSVAASTLDRMRHRDLTTVDVRGFPLPLPVSGARLTPEGIRLTLAGGAAPLVSAGPASLTLHDHDEAFSWAHNVTFVGTLRDDPEPLLVVDRALDTIDIPRGRIRQMLTIGRLRRRFAPQLAAAAERVGQPVPVVRPELVHRS